MDSTTARQRRGTAKPSMKKNALRVLLALATGSATGQGAAPPRCAASSPQVDCFLPWCASVGAQLLLASRKIQGSTRAPTFDMRAQRARRAAPGVEGSASARSALGCHPEGSEGSEGTTGTARSAGRRGPRAARSRIDVTHTLDTLSLLPLSSPLSPALPALRACAGAASQGPQRRPCRHLRGGKTRNEERKTPGGREEAGNETGCVGGAYPVGSESANSPAERRRRTCRRSRGRWSSLRWSCRSSCLGRCRRAGRAWAPVGAHRPQPREGRCARLSKPAAPPALAHPPMHGDTTPESPSSPSRTRA